ncbi:hypothetical protein Goklo_029185 [Gossypium klotzschianum]|uniref:Pentatricopeptide repeat-containing protein n=1 Tax=Gossypium klotzschianum TaxID=34286 RepID=A0A7J8W754_9ROSI|nr:hypothetical protein [Gossypium klotzschianum]
MPERTSTSVSTYLCETGTRENGDYVRNDLDISHLISILKYCDGEGCLEFGRTYHGLIAKTGLDGDEFVNTNLIDMYAKCGDINSAVMVFNQMPRLNVALCNCLISGYANCGLFQEAFRLFMNYESWGNKLNSYTYSFMLAICGILSAIEEGKQLHAQVVKMEYLSETIVSNALLTMYCKCEVLADAKSLFEWLPQRNIVYSQNILLLLLLLLRYSGVF